MSLLLTLLPSAQDKCDISAFTTKNILEQTSNFDPPSNHNLIPPQAVSSAVFNNRKTPSPINCPSPTVSQTNGSLDPSLFATPFQPTFPRQANTEDTNKTVDYKWPHTR